MMRAIAILVLCAAPLTLAQSEPASAPTTTFVLPEGPLQITVTGVQGIVQARTAPGEKWKPVTVGMVLNEGSEFRTGPRSGVRFVIPPDQTVALDRLGTVQVLKATFESGKLFTDLGMKYGRTRYDIESATRQHDATVRSPSSVLAVRGTKVSLYDQPPFAPEAVSLTGRAFFRDLHKEVYLGGKNQGKTKVNQSSDSPAAYALSNTQQDPKGIFSGRTQSDLYFQLAEAAYGGTDLSNLGVFSLLNRGGTVIGVLPVKEQLLFNLTFSRLPQTEEVPDVNLVITDPKGQTLSLQNPTNLNGGQFAGKQPFDADLGQGQINANYSISFPSGTYTLTETRVSGSAVTSLQITELNPNNLASVNVGPVNATLTATNPTFTYKDTFPKLPASATGGGTAIPASRHGKSR